MSKLTLDMIVKDKQKEEYLKAMKITEYGFKPCGKYKMIGCPSDLPFVRLEDEPHMTRCIMECKDCWEYVLKNKWGNK